MKKSINRIFAVGALASLSACGIFTEKEKDVVDPVHAHCEADNPKLDLRDPKQRFRVMDAFTGNPTYFTGEIKSASADSTVRVWSALVAKKDEYDLPTYGWDIDTTDKFKVTVSSDNKIECEVGRKIYKGLDI